jgi:hypothetical protein
MESGLEFRESSDRLYAFLPPQGERPIIGQSVTFHQPSCLKEEQGITVLFPSVDQYLGGFCLFGCIRILSVLDANRAFQRIIKPLSLWPAERGTQISYIALLDG